MTRYDKKRGAANGTGENYEWKKLTLLFLRMLSAGHEFQLASNMEAAGLFDDIVLRYRKHIDDAWKVSLFQLKHKQNNNIQKPELLGLSGPFSLVQYCHSYVSIEDKLHPGEEKQFMIFTNARLNDDLVDMVESNELFETGGQAVSFKAGGEVFKELCEWVDFKETLTELHGQVDGLSDEEVEIKMKVALEKVAFQNKAVKSYKEELLKSPCLVKLKEMLKKLEPVCDKDTYSLFLSKLIVYKNQAKESELDALIKEEFSKVWIRSRNPEAIVVFREFQDSMKLWWQNDNIYLTQNSSIYFEMIKSHIKALSKSTIEGLAQTGAAFRVECLENLRNNLTEGGILNLCVDSRTRASSLKVSQALAEFSDVLQVNIKALLEREDDLFAAWATRWCRVLVVECDAELDQEQTARISDRILKVFGTEPNKKLLVLIATKTHTLNAQLYRAECYTRLNDNVRWNDLTEQTKEALFAIKVGINGSQSPFTLSELLGGNNGFTKKADLEVISQLLSGEVSCGQVLEDVIQYFVTRRLKKSAIGVPFVVNSVSDVRKKVVLIVGEPGMGKSTLITHLARSATVKVPAAWVFHIKLNDHVNYLQEIDLEHFTEATAKKFLYQAVLNYENCLERLLIEYMEHKLVVFIDGVDEVCPHYSEHVLKLLSFLKGMKLNQLWVTSRPVFQTLLEETLKVKALHLVAFSWEDLKEFFNKTWKINVPSRTTETCQEITERLLTWLTEALDKSVLRVPLVAVMIAEIFQEQLFTTTTSGHCEFDSNIVLDVMHLYKTFIIKKFDVYCVEKKKISNRDPVANLEDEATLLKQLHHFHSLAALQALFSREKIERLQFEGKETFDVHLNNYLQKVSDGREKIGLIDKVTNGTPHFVHRSFAEYFVALWLSENFSNNTDLVMQIMFDPAYKLLSDMFNRFLTQKHPLHVAVLNRDLETIESLLCDTRNVIDVNSLDDGGRTPSILAILCSSKDQHADFCRIIEYLVFAHQARLDIADKVLNWTPLQYAEWSNAWTAMHIILENRGNAKQRLLSVIPTLNSWPKPDTSYMLEAASEASARVVNYLAEERGGSLSKTMVHSAAEEGNLEVLEYLLFKGLIPYGRGFEVNISAIYERKYLLGLGLFCLVLNPPVGLVFLAVITAKLYFERLKGPLDTSLLSMAFAGCLASVKELVEMGASPAYRNRKGHTAAWMAMQGLHVEVMNWLLVFGYTSEVSPLQAACDQRELDIIAFILSRRADINDEGCRGETPLISATRAKHWDVVKLLLEKGANCRRCDDKGMTPLHWASYHGNEEIKALLLLHNPDLNAKCIEGKTALQVEIERQTLTITTQHRTEGTHPKCRDSLRWKVIFVCICCLAISVWTLLWFDVTVHCDSLSYKEALERDELNVTICCSGKDVSSNSASTS